MLKDSFAPAKRALVFFGCMGLVVGGLTFGSGLQLPSDRSSTTIAAMRGAEPAGKTRMAAVDRSERSENAAQRAIQSSTRQALAQADRQTADSATFLR